MVTRLDLENAAALKRIAVALEEIVKLLKTLIETKKENSDVRA